MLVDRALAIRAFVPENYKEVAATFHPQGAPAEHTYKGTWVRERSDGADKESLAKSMRLAADGGEAEQIAARARTGVAAIESIEAKTQRMPPPLLYDLTELQRHANRLFGFSAQKTLDTAQALYERHKLISYPRTDSRHLSQDVAKTLPRVVAAIAEPYRDKLAPGTGERPLGRRYVDDAKVTDHHAIIPTTTAPRGDLPPDERKLYDLVCRRLLSAWHDDHILAVTTIITAIRNDALVDRYHTSGSAVQQEGWKALDIVLPKSSKGRKKGDDEEEATLPPGLAQGQLQDVVDVEVQEKKTRPPKRFTEATLLTAMETAGATLDEKELSEAMKETGLGTPATRAAIIEVLFKRGYAVRNGKSLEATDKGIRLIEAVHPEVKSPIMTGQWEAYLRRIHRGAAQLTGFMTGIEDYVREVVGKTKQVPAQPRARAASAPNGQPSAPAAASSPRPTPPTPPAPPKSYDGQPLPELLHSAFGFEQFRASQEAVCRALVDGKDVLLVMPTGSGKSLCYQLPALARGGTALVVSPLIALMDDQAEKLRRLGFAVEQIHSGRDRAASRQACVDYLNGRLQFLFIAPERLRVTGFPEMLAKRKPSLVAIDEAHCISQWGHDFRPDYRMLRNHLPGLRPAPVIALTATATPVVQHDIVGQLDLVMPERFVQGFRRDNLAIEVVEAAPSARAALTLELLQDDDRRPAIVYAPTRAQATSLAQELGEHFPCGAYHAGLDADHRDRVQQEFLSGRLEVIVATIAFGMGIDKPDVRTVIHTALPGSLEAYYQEIGRAGRDGQPSRTILMHSYADRRTHDFFFERDYPDVKILDAIFARLGRDPLPKNVLQKMVRLEGDLFDKALEKLWIQGGASVDFAENVARGEEGWREGYIAQSEQKQQQLELMLRFAEVNECRMASIVRHFGDLADSRNACGICDFCAPDDCVGQRFRTPTEREREAAQRAIAALRANPRPTGKLHGELYPDGSFSRDAFEEVLGGLARAGFVRIVAAEFEKDGRSIPYRKAALTLNANGLEEEEVPDFHIKVPVESTARKRKGKKTAKKAAKPAKAAKAAKAPQSAAPAAPPSDAATERLVEALRLWRLGEAKKQGVPAFRIFTDATMRAIVERRPSSTAELLDIPGMGLKSVEKYGAAIYSLVARAVRE
jgi:DNA topoisomerase-3